MGKPFVMGVGPPDRAGPVLLGPEHAPAQPSQLVRLRRFPAGLVVFGVLVLAFLILIWSHWYSFDPALSRLPISDHPLYFPFLITHIVVCTIAMITSVLQLWPWLRQAHRRAHVMSGRIYVLAGVYPGVLTSVALSLFWPSNPLVSVRDILVAVAWAAVTSYGLYLARHGRITEHRRWMVRSFALTTPLIMIGPLLGIPVSALFTPLLDTWFGGDRDVLRQAITATRLWCSVFLTVVAVEWWLERDLLRQPARLHPTGRTRRSVGPVRSRPAVAPISEPSRKALP